MKKRYKSQQCIVSCSCVIFLMSIIKTICQKISPFPHVYRLRSSNSLRSKSVIYYFITGPCICRFPCHSIYSCTAPKQTPSNTCVFIIFCHNNLEQHTNMYFEAWILLLSFIHVILGYPDGAPERACFYMTPRHTHPHTGQPCLKQMGPAPYRITVSNTTFTAGNPIHGKLIFQ